MNIKLTNEVLNLQDQKSNLSYLIQTIVRRKHKIVFDSDVQNIPSWLDSEDKDILEESLTASIIGDAPTPHCEVVKDASYISTDKIFNIKEAIDYANTPFTVMVENSNNDSSLIILILELYTRDKAESYYEGLLAFGHAGGCGTIKSVLTEKLKQNGQRAKMLRYYIIVDGDKRYDSHIVEKYNPLIKFLKQNKLPYHIFEKRCMENYMPVNAFPNSGENTNWLNAYKALSPVQRDFFNIGGGLKGDLSEDKKRLLKAKNSNIYTLLSKEQQHFYSDVAAANLSRLAEGYKIKSFKEEFPKGFNSTSITREMMDRIQEHQETPSELKQIADKIMDLL